MIVLENCMLILHPENNDINETFYPLVMKNIASIFLNIFNILIIGSMSHQMSFLNIVIIPVEII